jgi:hypothetical protein
VASPVDAAKCVIFDGRATAGAWGAFLRVLHLLPASAGRPGGTEGAER